MSKIVDYNSTNFICDSVLKAKLISEDKKKQTVKYSDKQTVKVNQIKDVQNLKVQFTTDREEENKVPELSDLDNSEDTETDADTLSHNKTSRPESELEDSRRLGDLPKKVKVEESDRQKTSCTISTIPLPRFLFSWTRAYMTIFDVLSYGSFYPQLLTTLSARLLWQIAWYVVEGFNMQ